jgi:hypothetical protein
MSGARRRGARHQIARARFVLGRTGQRALGRVWRVARRVGRPLRRRAERARSPWAPAAVVGGAEFDAAAMAALGERPRYAAANPRLATCTGVVWTRPDRVVIAYLLGRAFVTSEFAAPGRDGTPVSIDRRHVLGDRPEIGRITNVKVSRDRRWLAYGDDTYGHAAVLALDPATGGPAGIAGTVKVPGDAILHAIAFSPDGRYLLFSSVDVPGGLRVVPVTTDPATGRVTFGPVVCTPSPYLPSALKGLDFSPDGRWLALAYGANAGAHTTRASIPAFVEIRRWDAATGTPGPPVARSPRTWRVGGIEDVVWLAAGDRLLLTDQFRDQALIVACDPGSGALGSVLGRIGWATGGLRNPHGCAESPDGRWLAITNYGDGSLRIFDTADPASGGATRTV